MTDAPAEEKGADVALKVAGQELNIKNVKSLNTAITCLNFFCFCVLAVFIYFAAERAMAGDVANKNEHTAIVEALKESNRNMVQAIKETQSSNNAVLEKISAQAARQEQATRETNCLLSLPQDRRVNAAETCRRIAR